jgi:hypothetical protein
LELASVASSTPGVKHDPVFVTLLQNRFPNCHKIAALWNQLEAQLAANPAVAIATIPWNIEKRLYLRVICRDGHTQYALKKLKSPRFWQVDKSCPKMRPA